MKNINVRVPDDIHALVKAAAERDRRSLNAQIVWFLDQATADQDRSDSPPP